jgi:hypothetical protein
MAEVLMLAWEMMISLGTAACPGRAGPISNRAKKESGITQ